MEKGKGVDDGWVVRLVAQRVGGGKVQWQQKKGETLGSGKKE